MNNFKINFDKKKILSDLQRAVKDVHVSNELKKKVILKLHIITIVNKLKKRFHC